MNTQERMHEILNIVFVVNDKRLSVFSPLTKLPHNGGEGHADSFYNCNGLLIE